MVIVDAVPHRPVWLRGVTPPCTLPYVPDVRRQQTGFQRRPGQVSLSNWQTREPDVARTPALLARPARDAGG
ncbi:MAG: hypothetical protein JNL89_10030 [Rhodanobacteraceae bacterium]|nr:hypothetical protein [Rhodanobacteraceae bacterium]